MATHAPTTPTHGADPHHHDQPSGFAHQFEDIEQQLDSTTMGMWVFLAQEIMFFGGLFCGYTIYRSMMPDGFAAASNHLNVPLGLVNTIVLIASSLTMALAVRAAMLGNNPAVVRFLIGTLILGCTFLGVKVVEYTDKFTHHPGARL
jgi:cytochrome c oxidase subunit 3